MSAVAWDEASDEHRRAVDRALDLVLTQLHEPLDVGALADVAGYSQWHFQRVFREVTGETPAKFVMRARAERAAAIARVEPTRRWSDIATAVGFPTASQLSRAFAAVFDISPRNWDRATPLAATSIVRDLAQLGAAAPSAACVVEVSHLVGFRFAYRRIASPYAPGRLTDAWADIAAWCDRSDVRAQLIGMSWDNPDDVAPELCRYDLGVVLDATDSLPEWAAERWMPSTLIASVTVDGDIDAVAAAWGDLHDRWVPSAPVRRQPLPSIERFRDDPSTTGWTNWSLDCIVAITTTRSS